MAAAGCAPGSRPLSRRVFLAVATSALATPALARFPQTVPDGLVFFVGNSFTRQHGVPALVCRIATRTATVARCHPNTNNGAKLWQSVETARSYSRERGSRVPGTVVLQDHSLEPLTAEGRARSAEAMAVYAAQFERTVLFETWPRRAGHHLYSRPGEPSGPDEMVALVHEHYAAQAARLNAELAPIGLAWPAATSAGLDLYAADGYHANLRGAWLAAMMLAAAIGLPDPYSAPPPGGVDPGIAARLSDIARSQAG